MFYEFDASLMVVNPVLAWLGSRGHCPNLQLVVNLHIVNWFGRPHFPGASRQFGATQGGTRAAVVAREVRTDPVAYRHS